MSDRTHALLEAVAAVEQGEQHLAGQRARVAALATTRKTAEKLAAAKALLRVMEESQALRIARVERLRAN